MKKKKHTHKTYLGFPDLLVALALAIHSLLYCMPPGTIQSVLESLLNFCCSRICLSGFFAQGLLITGIIAVRGCLVILLIINMRNLHV